MLPCGPCVALVSLSPMPHTKGSLRKAHRAQMATLLKQLTNCNRNLNLEMRLRLRLLRDQFKQSTHNNNGTRHISGQQRASGMFLSWYCDGALQIQTQALVPRDEQHVAAGLTSTDGVRSRWNARRGERRT